MSRISNKPAAPVNPHHQVKTVYKDKHLEIDSDERLSRAQVKQIASRVRDAWRADEFEQGGAKRNGRVVVEVDSNRLVDRILQDPSHQVFASSEQNSILIRDNILRSRTNGTDNAALAHELGHVQDYVAAGNRQFRVPTFLREGKEYVLGARYDVRKGTPNPFQRDGAKALTRYTAKDAQEVFKRFRGPDENPEIKRGNLARDERLGALYVEWLRTRLGGSGKPDALAALARVTEAVGKKVPFGKAFAKEFGVPEKQAEAGFVKFLSDTQNNPEERLRGTIWEGMAR